MTRTKDPPGLGISNSSVDKFTPVCIFLVQVAKAEKESWFKSVSLKGINFTGKRQREFSLPSHPRRKPTLALDRLQAYSGAEGSPNCGKTPLLDSTPDPQRRPALGRPLASRHDTSLRYSQRRKRAQPKPWAGPAQGRGHAGGGRDMGLAGLTDAGFFAPLPAWGRRGCACLGGIFFKPYPLCHVLSFFSQRCIAL